MDWGSLVVLTTILAYTLAASTNHTSVAYSSTCCVAKNEIRLAKLEAAMKVMEDLLIEKCCASSASPVSSASSSSWQLMRKVIKLGSWEKITLHRKTPTLVETVPVVLPKNTKSVILSVFCHFGNHNGHAYLDGVLQQVGNTNGGAVVMKNYHYKVYSNTWYNEYLLPWNTDLPNQIKFKVTYSYLTGGSSNSYQIRVVGYITV